MSKENVRFWHKADIARLSSNVRFWGQSGHRPKVGECLLLTQSGHSVPDVAVLHNTACTPSGMLECHRRSEGRL